MGPSQKKKKKRRKKGKERKLPVVDKKLNQYAMVCSTVTQWEQTYSEQIYMETAHQSQH